MHATCKLPAGPGAAHRQAADLARLRCELFTEMRRAGYGAADLLQATGDYFERELAQHGPAATAVFFALFIARLCCRRSRAHSDGELAARADAPRHASSEAHAGSVFPPPCGPRHGISSKQLTLPLRAEFKAMADPSLLAYATTHAVEGELKRIAAMVGVRRARIDSPRQFSFRISVALQEEICAREREIADREALLSLVLSLGTASSTQRTE